MRLKRVNPNKIMVPEVRVTARMDEEKTEQFRASVKTTGIDEPIKVFEVEGELILSDGLHRLMEAKRLNLPMVDVYVREGTMVDVLCNNLMSGHLRGTHPVSEMVRSIEELWKEYKMDSEQIAAKTGMTREYVENLQLISELTPMGRKALDEGDLKEVGKALQLIRLKDPVMQETVLGQLLLYHWTIKELKEYVDTVLALSDINPKTPPAVPPEPYLIECHFCHGSLPINQVANPAMCTECAGILLMSLSAANAQIKEGQTDKTE